MNDASVGFWERLVTNYSDPIWWADNGSNYIIFSVIFGASFASIRLIFSWINNRKYKGWGIYLYGVDGSRQSIFWEDVRKFLGSDFEMWKYIKSNLSSVVRVASPGIAQAREAGWVEVNKRKKEIKIFFTKIPKEHVSEWQVVLPGINDQS